MVVSAGTGPMVGRAVGAKTPEQLSQIIGNSTLLMTVIGLIYSMGLYFGAPLMADWVGLSDETSTSFVNYLETLGLFGLFIAFGPLIDSIFIAAGDTKTPMWLQLGSTVLNGILNYVLIYALEYGNCRCRNGFRTKQGAHICDGILSHHQSILSLGSWMSWQVKSSEWVHQWRLEHSCMP